MRLPGRKTRGFGGWFGNGSKGRWFGTTWGIAWIRWLIGAVLVAFLVPLFPGVGSFRIRDMKEGTISTRRIVAPFNFEILKTEQEIARDRDVARRSVTPVFFWNDERGQEGLRDFRTFCNGVRSIRDFRGKSAARRSALVDSLFRRYPMVWSRPEHSRWILDPLQPLDRSRFSAFQSQVRDIVVAVLKKGVLDTEKQGIEASDQRLIILGANREEEIHSFDDCYDMSGAKAWANDHLVRRYGNQSPLVGLGIDLVGFFLKPNLVFDRVTTERETNNAVARVPLSSGFVYEDEKIVDRNERITPEINKKLISLAAKMSEMGMGESGWRSLLPVLGKVAFTSLILFLLVAFIGMSAPERLWDLKSILLIALVILVVGLLTFALRRIEASEYIIPSVLGAMLLAILFDAPLGFVGAAVLSVLVGGLWGSEYSVTAVSFFVSVMGVLTMRGLQNRRDWIRAMLFLMAAYVLGIGIMGLLRFLPPEEIVKQWPFGILAGLFSPILVWGFLPLVESVFDITTVYTLLELSNLNHPLLKRLSVEASGTYHHSIIVGNLAEAAAHVVGANSLLARVGSYYHDVGKIEKAEYFVENQIRGENPHEKLNPRMSALILMNHVKKGMEIADQYKIPSAIRDIVVQHQGTTMMTFFYEKAKTRDEAKEVREEDYRYPGPRPQSKEAAIVMLADAVEAAARSLKDPTHSRLKGLIEDLVAERFQGGQLDESPLTLRDLEKIKDAFLTILAGTFHARVEYPETEDTRAAGKSRKRKETPAADHRP